MKRSSGILLHPTSLPSPYGLGDFGQTAYQFIDYLKQAGQKIWQILPLTIPDKHGSPYASLSAMAGNWLLISPEKLLKDKFLVDKDLPRKQSAKPIRYPFVRKQKFVLLKKSFFYFQKQGTQQQKNAFKNFQEKEKTWLSDYALYMALKENFHNRPWYRWPKSLANRNRKALAQWQEKLSEKIAFYEYGQWIFFHQWENLKKYANDRRIKIFGDIPFFVYIDSVDVWANQSLFLLDNKNRPKFVAGVPPDYFSRSGQVWNNPQYNWSVMKKTKFIWLLKRFRQALRLYDLVRLDHFRGYESLWFIKHGRKNGRIGRWVKVPGDEFFSILQKKIKSLPIVAEDLGYITQEVIRLRDKYKFPGMRVMLFGLDGNKKNYHFFPNFPASCVAYTGTHDTDTTRGWLDKTGKNYETSFALKHLKVSRRNFCWKLIEAGMESKANIFITPLQDFLNLGASARLNTPATKNNNWQWCFNSQVLTPALAKKINDLTHFTHR